MSVQSTDIEPAIWKRPVLVTGAAGFIGSHLVEALLRDGATVHGVDDLDPWYDVAQKRANLAAALSHPRFHLTTTGAADASLSDLWDEVATVFHLAGRPGVQDSWGPGFEEYARRNVTDTNSVLDAALRSGV
ncbi:MAG: NAD(P)-dependent oxidoreductase, partial [Actinomycetota bacterium]